MVSQEEVLAAATAVEVAKAEERVLQTRLGYTQAKAPFAGVVSARLAEPGDVVARHSHVLTISDPGTLIIDLLVSELVLPELSIGDEASVRIDALGRGTFRGRILRIHPELDARTRQGRVEVALDPVPAGARAGQFARVEFNSTGRERKVIPFASLRRDREGEFVFVIDESRLARRVGVRSGQRLAERVEVLDGLEPGQAIVVRGFLGLSDGTTVTRVGTVDQVRPVDKVNDSPRPAG